MISDKTKELLALELKTLIAAGIPQVGLGGNSSSPSQTSLDVPSGFDATIITALSADNVIEAKVSVAGSLLTGTVIREMGLFDNATTVPAGGNLLSRINFEGVGPFAANETLEIFLIIEVE
tara:strand:+ start:1522 stop:1884 length:363 start_codon:yes stop_codon:yes gene_type:complete